VVRFRAVASPAGRGAAAGRAGGEGIRLADAPRLHWGRLLARGRRFGAGERIPSDLGRVWQVAAESSDLVVQPIERFELAGTLNGHPGHVRSDEAKRPFPAVFALAVAAATAPERFAALSLETAAAALLSWARVYRPTGNPVDEWFFLPLLEAVDLIAGAVPAEEAALLRAWARSFLVAGDSFYARLGITTAVRVNNWMSRRLVIRAVASTVSGETAARAATPALLREFVAHNLVPGPDGVPDGRTFDFLQRDALHYHVAALLPLVETALFAPDLVDHTVRAALLLGLDFLRPYFLGEREHIEFAKTTVAFDVARRDDGNPSFRLAPWDPRHGRVLLRLARAVLPEVRPWTEEIVDPAFDPRTKLLAAIFGEPLRAAEWASA
jgi:hypothetical protein